MSWAWLQQTTTASRLTPAAPGRSSSCTEEVAVPSRIHGSPTRWSAAATTCVSLASPRRPPATCCPPSPSSSLSRRTASSPNISLRMRHRTTVRSPLCGHNTGPYLKGRGYGFNPSTEIVADPQSTALGTPRAVHRGGEARIYLMSLTTQVVVRCSILCCKFTKNRLSAGLRA